MKIQIANIPLIDHHAHNLLEPEVFRQYPYSAAFSEGSDPPIIDYHARQTLCYRRSLRDIGALLQCEPTEAAILERREKLGIERLTQLCLSRSNIQSIFLDDGFQAEQILPLEWHQKFLPVYRLLRIESLAETLFSEIASFEKFLDSFRDRLTNLPANVVGFKSIAAYRTGLAIASISQQEAKTAFDLLKQTDKERPFRLQNKSLIDFLLATALEIAQRSQMPIQFHTGFGDRDLDLFFSNPLHLRSILEDSRYSNVPIVLLHGSYPFTRQAAYLASVYPQVYLDFGLAIPFLSVSGMRDTLRNLLELAPTSKIMYSSDAHFIPELYYLGSRWGREILKQVLIESIQDGDLTELEAETIARSILLENARNLYQIESKD
ncbi:MAG: amidohydrolase family protein [Prochloraceae cyanobacterium]|nr:amidohydrolase family protein [Prochloraceae cyanobacterium]